MCHHFHPLTDVQSCDEMAHYHGSSIDTLTHIHQFRHIDTIIPDLGSAAAYCLGLYSTSLRSHALNPLCDSFIKRTNMFLAWGSIDTPCFMA